MRLIKFKRETFKLPMNIAEFVKGTYEAYEFRLLSISVVKQGLHRWLSIVVCGLGMGVMYRMPCKCPDCKRNFWRRLFFMKEVHQ